MSLSRSRYASSEVRHRKAGLAVSIVLHAAAIFWLMTLREQSFQLTPEPPILTINLPLPVQEIVQVLEPAPIPDRGSSNVDTQGGGGGRIAQAIVKKPIAVTAPLDVPVPAIMLDLPTTVPLPVAPVSGPTIAGSGGYGTGQGTGDGDGTGSGTGSGDGAGTGSGAGVGSGLYQLQAAEWIVQPTPEQMRKAYPERAGFGGVSGVAQLSCTVKDKRAWECKVLKERPRGFDFGKAAIAAARQGLIKAPVTGPDEHPDRARVSIVVSFSSTR